MKTLAEGFGFIDLCVKSAIGMGENDGICYHTNSNPAFTS